MRMETCCPWTRIVPRLNSCCIDLGEKSKDMATNQHTLLRQWHMLQAVPRAPRRVSVRALQSRLSDAEFIVTERTIQRYPQELAQVFPLTVDERSKPFGWSWQQDSPSLDLPGLSVAEAFALTLVEQQLSNSLPPATLDTLRPHFSSAHQALGAIDPRAPAKDMHCRSCSGPCSGGSGCAAWRSVFAVRSRALAASSIRE